MLDGDNRRHTVSDVRSCKIRILFLQYAKLPGILVDGCCKGRLKSGQMGAALSVVDVVAETKDIFMELVDILKGSLNLNALGLSFKIHRIMHRLFLCVQVFNKPEDPIRLMVYDPLCLAPPQVLKDNGKLRIQVRSFMHPALHFIRPELSLFKDRVIRQEINLRSGLFRLPDDREQPVLKLYHRYPTLVPVMMDGSAPAHLHIHIDRQCVYHRGADPVKPAAGLIRGIIKFAPCMKGRIHNPLR